MAIAPEAALFDEILTSIPIPEHTITFEPPESLQQRLSYLLEENQSRGLTAEEQAELDEFLRINRFMSRLKLRVRRKLAS